MFVLLVHVQFYEEGGRDLIAIERLLGHAIWHKSCLQTDEKRLSWHLMYWTFNSAPGSDSTNLEITFFPFVLKLKITLSIFASLEVQITLPGGSNEEEKSVAVSYEA